MHIAKSGSSERKKGILVEISVLVIVLIEDFINSSWNFKVIHHIKARTAANLLIFIYCWCIQLKNFPYSDRNYLMSSNKRGLKRGIGISVESG